MSETWRPVVGFEGSHEVSDLGRVRSVGRVLIPYPDPRGYLTVRLCVRGRKYARRVHRLVLEAFDPPRPADMEACHGPNGKQDNSRANLSWGTSAKNNGPDRARDGTSNAGSRNGQAKWTEDQVAVMRARLASGERTTSVAADFGMSPRNMRRVARGEIWTVAA